MKVHGIEICSCDFEYDSYPQALKNGGSVLCCVFCDNPIPEQDLEILLED